LLLVVLTFTIPACTRRDEAEKAREQPSQETQEPFATGTYRRPLGNDPATLDPARITDMYAVAVANQIFDGLVGFDAYLNVQPALAQSWSASRDGLTWIFHLQQGVQFHNGREMIAADVVYSLSRLLDPAVRSPNSWSLSKVKGAAEFQAGVTKELEGIKAVDRYTVQVTLSEPFAPFISILGLPHLAIIPREEVERPGKDFAVSPIGTGPFRLVGWERGREVVLEANEHYFRGRPGLDGIRFVIFPGNVVSDILQAFERGELEESSIPLERRKELLEAAKYKVIRKPTLSIRLLGFNLTRPPFDRLEVRQAFNYAIDTAHLREIAGEHYVVARGILPPGMPGYKPEVQGYGYNQERAKELLAEAGHPRGQGLAPVTLASSQRSAEIRQESRAVQQYLEAIGVQVELRDFDDWATFEQALRQGETQMFRYGWYADYPDPDSFLYSLFHSQSQTNYFQYRNPAVDRLLDDARREPDDLRRAELYREAEQRILNDAPAVMLLHQTFERLFQTYVEGIEVSALGEPYIRMWKIRFTHPGQASPRK
jgi:peptide/nickel transport system substrate-binding protein/oligopeptide transport system substrate-binding protein